MRCNSGKGLAVDGRVLRAAIAAAFAAVLALGAAPRAGVAAGGAIQNGDFEAGSLAGWTVKQSASVTTSGCHGGTYCAMVGLETATRGDSSIRQSFKAPAGATVLSLWYEVVCDDTVEYDWAIARL